MSEIKFRLVDGEPVCDAQCEHYSPGSPRGYCGIMVKHREDATERSILPTWPGTSFCIPGLRQQRDEARRWFCEYRADEMRGRDEFIIFTPADAARNRGWEGLYE